MPAKHLRALTYVFCLTAASAQAAPPSVNLCRRAIIEGSVTAGQQFFKPIGNGLAFFLQPIASGWILRVVPATGLRGDHDYAELATPPYNSVTPLSISTDFAFRAQDAIGWNPRRFRFATNRASFDQILQIYKTLPLPPASLSPDVQQKLAGLILATSEGTFRVLDARLVPGSANQVLSAQAVASHFELTAHTLEHLDVPTLLGKVTWLRFRAELDIPASFGPVASLRATPITCSAHP